MTVPEYLDRIFFENVLKSGLQLEKVQVTDVNITLGSAPGDNYCSTIYRVVISYQKDGGSIVTKTNLIVKIMTKSGISSKLLERCKIFQKEVTMLENFLPKLSQLVNGIQFGPKFYYKFENDSACVIVMEDLSAKGYRMADRLLSLNSDHCAVAISKLSKMHAASMILIKEEPSIEDIFNFGFPEGSSDDPGIQQHVLSDLFPAFCKKVKTWKGFENISRKLEELKPILWKKTYECISREHDSFRVLNHGDFWINNFLFKYDEKSGKPLDCIFVDFQFTFYTSPAQDLQYFFGTSSLTERDQEELLNYYHETFKGFLEAKKNPIIPSIDDLKSEMSKRLLYNFFAATHILPAVLMEKQSEKGNGLDGILDETVKNDMFEIMLSGKRFVEVMQNNLRRWNKLGLFD